MLAKYVEFNRTGKGRATLDIVGIIAARVGAISITAETMPE